MSFSLLTFSFVFFVAAASLYIFRKIAKVIGLVDKPNIRKHHSGSIPLIGGVSICFTVVHYLYLNPILFDNNNWYICSIICLTLLGTIDDRFDISFKIRIIVQAIISILMIEYTGIMLANLGNMFGFGQASLTLLAVPVTVIAVIGAINAFNMVDGIDGLLGGLSIVTFSSISILMYWTNQTDKLYISLLFIVSIIPFILMNLGVIGRERKVFMGDAGSMMIGFTVIWLLLGASQDNQVSTIRPVTCLWLISIPLMDMTSIMIRRIQKKRSPFMPDREHLHHIFQNKGFNTHSTLILICALATLFSGIGLIGEYYQIAEPIMFWGFLILFLIYNSILQLISKTTSDLSNN
ncbi:UDP-N-acetylglucosamine--undecaprenyl-phosphate N-acetylglucosaminephosphotransferase [Psychrosphaera sp. F3M07]|uniref:UDP-N-acetylglucosamine--undecaprenyl-phosphate N-acetylglucosaminephosphotransferase n=1 Tax=Psychrosphaera sp. F3M07 TaxID=2841560 RepID=UPI001C097852|nr:UDP-N-acetylglucosamine--undecaprenyl-phosphate N-acetylglucosaminephosphotransferase [Psychrosphaera sp. F3M07]MBU2917732.1 UDP-N-acetylglucosamine--undecaprenyl-phosphate N-acetylglucosaminephosphotransferase [Psychrosphaera sp. F3M07]